jgi:hypothetical protein
MFGLDVCVGPNFPIGDDFAQAQKHFSGHGHMDLEMKKWQSSIMANRRTFLNTAAITGFRTPILRSRILRICGRERWMIRG